MPTAGTVSLRPLTAAERATLRAHGPTRVLSSRVVVGGLLWLLFFTLGIVALGILDRWFSVSAGREGSALLFICLGALSFASLVAARTVKPPAREAWARDFRRGEAEVTRYSVEEAVEVEPFEDEGETWFLRASDGRVLVLSGQSDFEEGTFPSSVVEVSRAPGLRLVLGVQPGGEPLASVTVLPPFPASRVRAGAIPADGDVLTESFEAIRSGEAYGNPPAMGQGQVRRAPPHP